MRDRERCYGYIRRPALGNAVNAGEGAVVWIGSEEEHSCYWQKLNANA